MKAGRRSGALFLERAGNELLLVQLRNSPRVQRGRTTGQLRGRNISLASHDKSGGAIVSTSGTNQTYLPLTRVAIRTVRIREVDPRAKRIGRSAPRIERRHARRIGYDTTVFLHRSLGMCA